MIGKTIGRYQILSEIGRGGMAVVYLGQDPSFHRQVAIKVLPTQFLENILLRARFEREARTIATLEHPAIVPVHDFGEQDGQLYLVMRFMPGGSLAQRLSQGALPPAEAIDIITQLAPALDAVHARGIVHRDLKPGNILFDAFGNPALSDFGIAQLTEATVDLTGDAIIGTPAYMSPEQVSSNVQIDGRSDVYALGVILFEMLTGQQPYRAGTPLSVAMKHLTDPVPRLQTLHPQFPPELDAVLAKAMAKEREHRYTRVADLAADLRSLPDLPLSAPGATVVDVAGTAKQDATLPDSGELQVVSEPPSHLEAPPAMSVSPAVNRTDTHPSKPIPSAAPVKPAASQRAWLLSLSAGGVLTLVGLCLVAVLGFAAYRSGFLAGLFPADTPGPTALGAQVAATQTQAPRTGEPEPSPTFPAFPSGGTLLFSDDFSVRGHGWPQGASDGAQYTYDRGTYRITVDQRNILFWGAPSGTFSDTSTSTLADLTTGGGESYFGHLCRIQDKNNLYYLVVRADGYFTIGKLKDGQFNTLLPAGWTYSDALADADRPYLLRADCTGDTLRLFLGDTFLGQAQDSDFRSGQLGLGLAAIGADERMEVTFDEFIVRELK